MLQEGIKSVISDMAFPTLLTCTLLWVWSSSSTWSGLGSKSSLKTCVYHLDFDLTPFSQKSQYLSYWFCYYAHCVTLLRYIFLYYIPTGLIVVTSWIFFLLPSTSYPARFLPQVFTFFTFLFMIFFHRVSCKVFSQTFPPLLTLNSNIFLLHSTSYPQSMLLIIIHLPYFDVS